VLACGGLIQQALALGDSVWVMYMTAGDGSWPSAWHVTGNLFPGPEDYLELGRARMEEATAGTKALGLDSTQLTFLGYPDADLARLWQQDWYTPCRSSHTGAIADPYGRNGHEYTGKNLLSDLVSLIITLRPDRVFAPHPLDAHPDHWSTFPMVYYYLVHHPSYPDAWTDDAGFLSPPDNLAGAGHHWFTIRLTDEQRRTKQTALGCHDSQRGSAGNDLYGYVAGNELSDCVEDITGPVTEDAPQVAFMPAARFSLVQASVEGESLSLRVSLEAEPSSGLNYSFFVHSVGFDAESVVHSGFTVELTPGPSADSQGWSIRMPRNQPSGNGALLYSTEAKWGSVLLNHSGIGRIVY
jgi:LmbE family N-acetylglucosaminyl deacetylase